ncbi:MAG: RNA polymerase sigma factor [Acidimicrobiales bacterium]
MDPVRARVAEVVRDEWPQLMAVLYRDLGDLGAAEDAAQEAAALALSRWLDDGIPDRPGAWITTVARRKALDQIRRARTGRDKTEQLARLEEPLAEATPASTDDQLRLFFGCCHPALSVEAQVALTLRSLGGLTTAEIARGFLVPEPTMAQRIVRAKRKIASAAIPFRIPDDAELLDRIGVVHHVLYLVFNEGAYASSGTEPLRVDLADESIRLIRLLGELMTDDAETHGLLALCLFIDARRPARTDGQLLADQDRTLWLGDEIAEATALLDQAMRRGRPGPYQIEAAINAVHADAVTAAATDWPQIAALYRTLLVYRPTPVVALNHAVAVAECEGPEVGLHLLDADDVATPLADYRYYHSARGELLRRAGEEAAARSAYQRALELTSNEVDRRFLQSRLGVRAAP